MQFTTTINAPIERVFDLIARIDRYGDWLATSGLYAATQDISEIPVRAGTTYVDQGQNGPMPGRVTEYQSPTHIAFEQEQRLGPGQLRIEAKYTLVVTGASTHVTRDLTFHTSGLLVLMRPVLRVILPKENKRILAAMKAHLEK